MATATQRRGRPRDDEDRFEKEYRRGARSYEEHGDWEPERGSGSRRGFASWEPEEQHQVASRGGRHSRGRSDDYEEDYEQPRSRRQYEEEENYQTVERGRSWTGRRGFAAMDPERQREIASEGGRAPHRGPRGFAAMDEDEQREIASEGGRAP